MIALLLLWLACSDPAPLPPSKVVTPTTQGRVVQAGEVRGYLARPIADGAVRGIVLRVSGSGAQLAADQRAAAGQVVLAISPEISTEAAVAYVGAIPGILTVQTECLPSDCR